MANIIQTKRSFTVGVVPPLGSLLEGQLAVNVPDKKIWIGDSSNNPVLIYDPISSGVTDHLLLTNIGTNTHATIDGHIAALSGNPHNVDYSELVGTPVPTDWADIPNKPTTFAPAAHLHVLDDVSDSGSMAAVDDAPSDGKTYGRNMAAWVLSSGFLPSDVFGGSGISVSQESPGVGQITIHSEAPQSIKARWLWEDSGLVADPGTGNMGADQPLAADMTQMLSSFIDADGQDVSSIIDLIAIDDTFLVIDSTTGIVAIFTVTAPPIDGVTWASTPVVFAAGDGTLDPVAGDSMQVQWFPKAGDPVVGPHQHDHDGPDIINTGTNTHAAIDAHIADLANPHAVTAAQVGAEPANANIQAHITDITTNPHAVTFDQVGAAPTDHDHDAGTF